MKVKEPSDTTSSSIIFKVLVSMRQLCPPESPTTFLRTILTKEKNETPLTSDPRNFPAERPSGIRPAIYSSQNPCNIIAGNVNNFEVDQLP